MNVLAESMRGAAARFGARSALVADDGTVTTYAELDRWSDEVAAWLVAEHRIAEEAVVGLVMPSGPEYVVAYLALAKLGAVTAGVSPRLAGPERANVLERLAADVVLEARGGASAHPFPRESKGSADRALAEVVIHSPT
ncbi:MAG: AMP-binding protein, partial [Acidimicrobiales bacterium]